MSAGVRDPRRDEWGFGARCAQDGCYEIGREPDGKCNRHHRAATALPAGLPDVETLAAAMSSWWRPNDHGQLCPVWTQRRAIQHSPCNCFIEDRSRRHAAHILAALEGSATLPSDR